MSSGAASSTCAAMRRPRSTIFSVARSTAEPPTVSAPEPPLPRPLAEHVAVAPEDLDALGRHAERVAHDLREGGLVALAHRRRAREERHRAVGVDTQICAVSGLTEV